MGNSPTSQQFDWNMVIREVADAIKDDGQLMKLGDQLGIKRSTISKAIRKNWEENERTSFGNWWMLQKWSKTVKPAQHVNTLKKALNSAGLSHIVESCFSGGTIIRRSTRHPPKRLENTSGLGTSGACPDYGSPSRTMSYLESESGYDDDGISENVQLLKDQLRKRYMDEFSQIKTAPGDNDSRTVLQNIFVSLLLILKSSIMYGEDKEMDVRGLYDMIQNKTGTRSPLTRFALLGKVGAGKSTLLKKIAVEWAMDKCLQDIDFLFLESFQDMEENEYFGNIVMKHFQDATDLDGRWIDNYIKKNQRKVAILIADLDEKKMNLMEKNSKNAVLSIVRGEKFKDTPVLISTRPYVVDLIKSKESICGLYTFIEVKGFHEKGVQKYITQFFAKDKESADSLIQFVMSSTVVSEYIAPFPVFCSMLCNIWKNNSKRAHLTRLGTTSQLMDEIWFSLVELHATKHCEGDSTDDKYESLVKKAKSVKTKLGDVAFDGLVKNQVSFTEESLEKCSEAARTAYEIGILSKEKRHAPREVRENLGKQHIEEFGFFHKLLQEYLASFHLESLHHADRSQFNKILKDELLVDYEKYRHVLYFTAARQGEVGRSLINALCSNVDDITFIIEVAFELQDPGALDPVRTLLRGKRSFATDYMDEHGLAANVYALKTYRREEIHEVKHSNSTSISRRLSADGPANYAKALFDLPNLRVLELADNNLQSDFFYSEMAQKGKTLQIRTLKHELGFVSAKASSQYAKAIISMPKLENLEFCDVELNDAFFSELADGAAYSKVVNLKHEGGARLGSAASVQYATAIVSMPNLRDLKLCNLKLDNDFYRKMANGASKSTLVKLKHEGGDRLSPDASAHYATAIVSMPKLQELELSDVELDYRFYRPTAQSNVSNSKIETLKHSGGHLDRDASSHYGSALCSMPCLKTLELKNVGLQDEPFYLALARDAVKSKIEVLRHADADLGDIASSHYAKGLFSMPCLRSLELNRVKLADEFYSFMAKEASKSGIDTLRMESASLSPMSSFHYARGLFAMPKLKSLELSKVKLKEEFFTSMSTDAAECKIVKLKHVGANLGRDASHRYAEALCSMEKLYHIELHDLELTEDFTKVLGTDAQKSKIRTVVVKRCALNRQMLNAFLSFPRLQSFTLEGQLKFAGNTRSQILMTNSVTELSLDVRNVADLWKDGFQKSCPRVKKLTLLFFEIDCDSLGIIHTACSPFHYLNELRIDWMKTPNPEEFSKIVIESCPKLTTLSLSRIKLHNDGAIKIIQRLGAHYNLTILEMRSCFTDHYLDQEIEALNSKNKFTVTITHD